MAGMRIFRTADDMMYDLGYHKVEDSVSCKDLSGVTYERFMGDGVGTKVIALERQDDGHYILGCFNKSGSVLGAGGHTMSWLTDKEMKAAYRKMKELRSKE